ncbi:MAG TPA: hypothetical protein VLT59_03410 [Steroidobacteraceae bacterium]|nr:hypothetical protein [Steroidobacteraceae bacterium]
MTFIRTAAGLAMFATLQSVAGAAEQNPVRIYRCETPAGTEFSDRPCGKDAVEVALEAASINVYSPPPLTLHDPAPAGGNAGTRRPAEVRPHSDARSRPDCESLRERIARIDSRMRQGYRGRTGERLRESRRAAIRKLVDAGCR